MPSDRPRNAIPSVENRTRVGTGRAVLANVDMRTGMGRRFREIIAQIEADLGGDVSEAKRALIVRSAALIAWLEDQEARLARGEEFEPGPYTTSVNTLQRLLSAIGLERKPKDVVDLQSYLAAEADNVD